MKIFKERNDIPKISNPFTNPKVHFPHPYELTGNDQLKGREKI